MDCSPPGSSIHGYFQARGILYQTEKQASLLTKTSWGSGQSTSTWEGAPVVHPENRSAGTREAISHSNCARQNTSSPELLGPGKGSKRRPNQICASEDYPSAWTWAAWTWEVSPGPASDCSGGTTYSPSSVGREATRAVSGGRPSVAEALRAHASVICLQHPSLPPHSATEQVSLKKKKKKKVSSTVPFVSGREPDTEEPSQQKQL